MVAKPSQRCDERAATTTEQEPNRPSSWNPPPPQDTPAGWHQPQQGMTGEQPSADLSCYPGQPSIQPDQRSVSQSGNGLALAAMICGIISIPIAVLVAFGGVALGTVAIVLGFLSRRTEKPKPALAGLITGVIGAVLGIANGILGALLLSGWLHLTRDSPSI